MLKIRWVVWGLVVLFAAYVLTVRFSLEPQPSVITVSTSIPQPAGPLMCVLRTKRWSNDFLPFQNIVDVYDSQGNLLRNGRCVMPDPGDAFVDWDGDWIDVRGQSSWISGGAYYGGKMFWLEDMCSDQGLRDLQGCPAKVHLYLSGRNITDTGLLNLRGLPRLKTVYISSAPNVTRAGVMALKSALPQLEVAGTDSGVVSTK